jgi:hypothetical protein
MGQGGKPTGGKPTGKGEKGGKPAGGKPGTKSGKDTATKQQNNKNSMSVLASICCLSIMYSIIMAFLTTKAVDNPDIMAKLRSM